MLKLYFSLTFSSKINNTGSQNVKSQSPTYERYRLTVVLTTLAADLTGYSRKGNKRGGNKRRGVEFRENFFGENPKNVW